MTSCKKEIRLKIPHLYGGELEKRKLLGKFCKYHKDQGHEIDNYNKFKDQIEELVHNRTLRQYAKATIAMVTNLVITPHNTMHVVFKVITRDNHHNWAVSEHKLEKNLHILEDNGYNFWEDLNTKTWEDNGVSFTDKDLYGFCNIIQIW